MRIVFMGTPVFASPSLIRLHQSDHDIVAVVTGIDRRRGRGHAMQPTPIAMRAQEAGIPVLKTDRVGDPEMIDRLTALAPDAIVLVAFGQLLPPRLLQLPPYGAINLHPSLLPRHRGAAPIHAPILVGDEQTGVSTMYMSEQLDAGDIILQQSTVIEGEETVGELHDRLAEMGADLLMETIDQVARQRAPRTQQDHALATYADKVTAAEIDWTQDASAVARTIRGLSPFPGAYTFFKSRRIKMIRARVQLTDQETSIPPEVAAPSSRAVVPGYVSEIRSDGFIVTAGQGAVFVTEVQPAGKAVMTAADFARGYDITPGVIFGQ